MALYINDSLALWEVELRDAPALYALIDKNRRHLRGFMGWVDANQSVADVELFINGSIQRRLVQNGVDYTVRYNGSILGIIGLHYIDWMNHRTSIGYWMSEEAQGRGIMTAAVHRLIAYALDELGLNRIEIHCAVQNEKSRAIPERLGFTQEGRIRQGEWLYDHYVDHIIYGLLKSEWRMRRD